ncbi:GxxExxY protein [Patescibacteria group bacterium]|nr:GxxExxY protein [Patescibacteria group bacterium]
MQKEENKTKLLYEEESYKIRGLFMEIYNKLGPGLKESIYGNALEELFKKEGIQYKREPNMTVEFNGKKVGDYRPDFLVYDKIIIELKSVPQIPRTQIQRVYQYLRSSGHNLGFIVNFGCPRLQIIRRIYDIGKLSVKSVANQFNLRSDCGQSLIEVLVAVAIFIGGISLIGFLVIDAGIASRQASERTRALSLAKEGLEAVRSIRDNSFANLVNGSHGLILSGNQWTFSGASDVQDQFNRSITITEIDSNTKKIVSNVNWQFSSNRPAEVELATYLTNWQQISITSCSEYCQSISYVAGTCRQNLSQCTSNGEINESGGDSYCTAPANFCCCAP